MAPPKYRRESHRGFGWRRVRYLV